MFIASRTFIFDGREEVTLLKTVNSYRRKKTVKKKQEERKKGPLIFFPPEFFLFSLCVSSFSCSYPTENAHQIFGYGLALPLLFPHSLFCLFLFPNSSTRSIYCKSAGFRRLIRQVQDHKIRVSLFMSRQLHTAW